MIYNITFTYIIENDKKISQNSKKWHDATSCVVVLWHLNLKSDYNDLEPTISKSFIVDGVLGYGDDSRQHKQQHPESLAVFVRPRAGSDVWKAYLQWLWRHLFLRSYSLRLTYTIPALHRPSCHFQWAGEARAILPSRLPFQI